MACLCLVLALAAGSARAAGFRYQLPNPARAPQTWETVIGWIQGHTVAEGETILDIARNYGLGYNEMEILYPKLDPWVPTMGSRLLIPSQWILPPTAKEGIVINIPEMRLYRFYPKTQMVRTYPVGIGDEGWESPEGSYKVVDRKVDPIWTVPKSLREKYETSTVPPGPENPLGKYWLGLSAKGYGIHGTNFPWAVGRLVTHGCIRLYPEDIEQLFPEVPVNTPVELIYEPVKVGFQNGQIYMEVHPDTYRKGLGLEALATKRLGQLGLAHAVSWDEVRAAVSQANGVPVRIGVIPRGKPQPPAGPRKTGAMTAANTAARR
jgi:L,D-transpeptidase ErfK/SrfK